ncbi:MAG: hypothetical protein ACOYD4_01280 [Solirubrobacterales bacterium]
MSARLSIPQRFTGPLESGNGGYCAGLFATLVDEPAAVNLRRPVPLEAPLDPVDAGGGEVHVKHGEELIAEVQPAPAPAREVPDPVGLEPARAATERYRGAPHGVFSECFVCGRARPDSLGVFAGQVGARPLVASPWAPPRWGAGEDGAVRPELVWSVLDCPTVFAAFLGSDADPIAYLVRFNVELLAPVAAVEEHVVVGWPLARDGRKHRAGSAVLSADGEVLARAEALMIEPPAG